MASYNIGDDAKLTATFLDSTGANIDPATVSLKVKDPTGTTTTFVYPTNISKVTTGVYTYTQDCTLAGLWKYRWYSTGTGKAAAEASFNVIVSIVLP